jgi:NAD(P)-dependent dehydrogenase (short-subunit alcohol dehydrogenase family)
MGRRIRPARCPRQRRQPGPTRTEGTAAYGEALEQLAATAPAQRPATAEEIAEAVVFLATDRSSFIHGAILPGTLNRRQPTRSRPK